MAVSVDICKRLGNFNLNVRFKAEDCTHALLGASGCGKSLTLLCIAGVMKPDSGLIELNGRTLFDSSRGVDLPPQKRRVGLLFQHYALFPNMTAEENLRAALRPKGRSGDGEAIENMLRRFGLLGLENHYPAQLSGGQQQRVALARILLSEPELLMLDEPLSALDGRLRRQTELELTEIFDSFPGTVLLVSHSRGEARRLCRSVTVLDNGLGEGSLPVEQLFRAPQTLSQALAAGWENCSRIKRISDTRIYAEDWDFELSLPEVPEDCAYIAVRARSLRLSDQLGSNIIPLKIRRVIADLSCTALIASASEKAAPSGLLRLESDSAVLPAAGEEALWHFPAEELLLLKK